MSAWSRLVAADPYPADRQRRVRLSQRQKSRAIRLWDYGRIAIHDIGEQAVVPDTPEARCLWAAYELTIFEAIGGVMRNGSTSPTRRALLQADAQAFFEDFRGPLWAELFGLDPEYVRRKVRWAKTANSTKFEKIASLGWSDGAGDKPQGARSRRAARRVTARSKGGSSRGSGRRASSSRSP